MSKELTVKQIKEQLKLVTRLDDPFFMSLYNDERKGVQAVLMTAENRLKRQIVLRQHFIEMQEFENDCRDKGYQFIAGIDEVGRGPLAGPVVACAVILPVDFKLIEVNDSKQLSATKRAYLAKEIKEKALAIGVGIIDEKTIDSVNIYEATKLAMQQAIDKLAISPEYLLIDAMTLPVDIPQESIIKGDARSISIACASIIAKETRDDLMKEYDQQYPGYGFSKNAGYGTKEHLTGIEKIGICPIHRRSFSPIKELI